MNLLPFSVVFDNLGRCTFRDLDNEPLYSKRLKVSDDLWYIQAYKSVERTVEKLDHGSFPFTRRWVPWLFSKEDDGKDDKTLVAFIDRVLAVFSDYFHIALILHGPGLETLPGSDAGTEAASCS